MVKKYFLWAALAVAAILPSCKQDSPMMNQEEGEQFVPRGEKIALDLYGSTDNMRGIKYDLTDGTPKFKKLTPGSKVKVLCVFRKYGDAASTTYKELEWTVEDDGKSIRYRGEVTLANGSMKKTDNGKWYMMAIIGGEQSNTTTADAPTKAKVSFDASKLKLATDNELDLDVPYVLAWTTLDVKTDAYGENKALTFQPQGSILRYQVRNAMVNTYMLSKIYVATDAFTTKGSFKLSNIEDYMLSSGSLPEWETTQRVQVKAYDVNNYTHTSEEGFFSVPLWRHPSLVQTTVVNRPKRSYIAYELDDIEYIESASMSQTLYAWVMPTQENKQGDTRVYADVQATSPKSAPMSHAIPVFQTLEQPMPGQFHDLYPEITSELSISAVYAHYPEPNVERKPVAPPTGGVGGSGPGRMPPHNLSATVIYNPTIYPIDLMEYGLVRMGYFEGMPSYSFDASRDLPYFNRGETGAATETHPNATVMPLAIALGNHNPFAGVFGQWSTQYRGDYSEAQGDGTEENPSRYKLVAGVQPTLNDGKLLLQPGKCAVFLSGGFLSQWSSEKEKADELAVYLQKAVDKGYCQFAVAYSDAGRAYNGFYTSSYQNSPQAGVLDVGTGQGMVLLRYHQPVSRNTSELYRFVDNSIPFKNAYVAPNTQYSVDLDYFYNQMIANGYLDTEHAYLTKRGAGSYHPIGHSAQFISSVNNYTYLWSSTLADPADVYTRICTPAEGHINIEYVSNFVTPQAAPWSGRGRSHWTERRLGWEY